jgi:hypothetical protein
MLRIRSTVFINFGRAEKDSVNANFLVPIAIDPCAHASPTKVFLHQTIREAARATTDMIFKACRNAWNGALDAAVGHDMTAASTSGSSGTTIGCTGFH